jgi:polyisoprenoid-binding protein YceI
MIRAFGLGVFLLFLNIASPAWAESKTYLSPETSMNALMIFEQGGFSRVYGLFTKGLARFQYDDQLKQIDAFKTALLVNSFVSPQPTLALSFSKNLPDKENEVAFVQTEAARFDGKKAKLKGQLIINGIRKDVVMTADLNRYGRVSQTTDVMEDGKEMVGISMFTTFKRSDFSMSSEATGNIFNDDATLMLEIIGQRSP